MFSINITLSPGTAVRVLEGHPVVKMRRDENTGYYDLGMLTFESPEFFELEMLKTDPLLHAVTVLGVATPGGKEGAL